MKTQTIKITRDTVIQGRDCFVGEEVEVDFKTAHEVARLGRAVLVEDMQDIDIDVDIYSLKKNDLVEYASSLGIDVPSSATKEEIVNLVEDFELEQDK